MTRILLAVSLALGFTGFARVPVAAPSDSDILESLETTAEHIRQERFGAAIRTAEAAADRGLEHPDLSFNRGLSYMSRAKTPSAESGDLGQAAAGFAEARQLRPSDAEAKRGLEQAQLVIAEDRSQSDTSPESASLGLVERVLLAVPAWVLFAIGALGSLMTCVGLGLRPAKAESRKLVGGILTLVGALLLVPSAGLSVMRHSLFDDARVAVVISDSAEVVDESGKRIPSRLAYRRGTLIHIGDTSRGIAPLVNLGTRAYVPVARLRLLAGSVQ